MGRFGRVIVLSITSLGLYQTVTGAWAQAPTQPQTPAGTRTPPPLPKENHNTQRVANVRVTQTQKPLDKQIDIPNLPPYPGKTQYLGGKIVEVPNAATYTMTFLATDTPAKVRDWYVSAFSGYNWKQTIHPTSHEVSGMTTDGNSLTVTFVGNTEVPPYKSRVMVMYHQRQAMKK